MTNGIQTCPVCEAENVFCRLFHDGSRYPVNSSRSGYWVACEECESDIKAEMKEMNNNFLSYRGY